MAESLPEVTIESSFETDLYPKRLAGTNDQNVWIADWLGDLVLATKDGKILRTLELEFHINDIVVLNSGDLLLTDEDNRKVVQLNDRGVISDFHVTEPFEPCGICITETGDVIITLCLYNPDTDMHTGKIQYLSVDGNIGKSLQNDSNGFDVFAKPHFITCNINKDIWIQDWEHQHVIVIDNKGRVRFRYKGQGQNTNMSSDFYPLGLEHNKVGQVIIADYYNAALHLVDKDGQFIRYIMTAINGLCKPFPIAKDKNDSVIVGDEKNKTVFIVRYN